MSIRVLIVDDNTEKLGQIIQAVEAGGLERRDVDVAQTGASARDHLSRTHYDLMILDIALPMLPEQEPDKKGGILLLDEIVERDQFNLPSNVIGLTGYDELRSEFNDHFSSNLWALEHYDRSDTSWMQKITARIGYMVAENCRGKTTEYNTDLCIITALAEPELAAVRKLPWLWSEATALDHVNFCYRGIVETDARNFAVVAAAAPRMGMTAASTLTYALIEKFRPKILAMTGICAGIKSECEIGDVIVASPAWDWQMGKFMKGQFRAAPDQLQVPAEISQRFKLIDQDKNFLFKLHNNFSGDKPRSLPQIKVGPMASGATVLADRKTVEEIQEQHRKLIGIDMEAYGVYSASRDAPPPRPITFCIKGVSDYADDAKADTYQAYASYISAEILAEFSRRYLKELTSRLGKGQ